MGARLRSLSHRCGGGVFHANPTFARSETALTSCSRLAQQAGRKRLEGTRMAPVTDRTETTLRTHSDTLSASPSRSDETTTRALVSRAVERARAGDRDALRFLYARCADDVYGYARTIVSDDDEARDVTLRVFARLAQLIDRYEEQDAPFGVWIRRALAASPAPGAAAGDDRAVADRDQVGHQLPLRAHHAGEHPLPQPPEEQHDISYARQSCVGDRSFSWSLPNKACQSMRPRAECSLAGTGGLQHQ